MCSMYMYEPTFVNSVSPILNSLRPCSLLLMVTWTFLTFSTFTFSYTIVLGVDKKNASLFSPVEKLHCLKELCRKFIKIHRVRAAKEWGKYKNQGLFLAQDPNLIPRLSLLFLPCRVWKSLGMRLQKPLSSKHWKICDIRGPVTMQWYLQMSWGRWNILS